jgi:uncharacterized protein YehS (DUF1456 family)
VESNNDVLRSIRYALDLPDAALAELVGLSGAKLAPALIPGLLKKQDEDGYIVCDDELLLSFLDGLIVHRRGPSDTKPLPVKRLTNNIILKKLRVAFELKEEDLHDIIKLAGFQISKPELSAVFRSPESKNYRVCGDQLLRYFLKGLSQRLRG